MIYGYHRTSTADQHLDHGNIDIENFCKNNKLKLERIYIDQQTASDYSNPRYQVLKNEVLKNGDILIITDLTRLGRTKQEILKALQFLKDNSIRIMILNLPTTTQDLSLLDGASAQILQDNLHNMLIELCSALIHTDIDKKERKYSDTKRSKTSKGSSEQETFHREKVSGAWNSVNNKLSSIPFWVFRDK